MVLPLSESWLVPKQDLTDQMLGDAELLASGRYSRRRMSRYG